MGHPGKPSIMAKKLSVHSELIEIIEELRKDVETISYGAWNKNLSYTDLTQLLARKIKASGGVKKLRGTV